MSGADKRLRRQIRQAMSKNARVLYPLFWEKLCELPLGERIKAAYRIITKKKAAKVEDINHG